MSYNESLKRLLSAATSVRATEYGFNPKRRRDSETLFVRTLIDAGCDSDWARIAVEVLSKRQTNGTGSQ